MRVPRIFTDQALNVGSCVSLSAAASHHITHVLRMAIGRPVILFNGKGGEYAGTIARVTKKTVAITITGFDNVDRESHLAIALAVCLIKRDRMDWLLQKATELGVTEISLLLSERTDYPARTDHMAKKWQRWRQVVVSACEQCGRTRPPSIQAPLRLASWLTTVTSDKRYILQPSNDKEHSGPRKHNRDRQWQYDGRNPPSSLVLLIGPEGGFTEAEQRSAADYQFSPLALGPRILRAETAPLVALAIMQRYFGDL